MKVGTVFCWNRFLHRGRESKNSWFIYLGKTGYGADPPHAYIGRTTTQLNYYAPGQYRARRKKMSFARGECGFEEECLLDVDEDIISTLMVEFEESTEIVLKGCLPDNKLRKLLQLILSSGNSRLVKADIKSSFRGCGIREA